MPFGLNVATRIFTKLVSSVVKILQLRGVQSVTYLDDWLLWASSPRLCQEALEETVSLLRRLGFCINLKKSRLTLMRVFDSLGLRWSVKSHTLCSITKEKDSVYGQTDATFSLMTRRKQESLHSFLQFLSIAIPILKIRLKDFQ